MFTSSITKLFKTFIAQYLHQYFTKAITIFYRTPSETNHPLPPPPISPDETVQSRSLWRNVSTIGRFFLEPLVHTQAWNSCTLHGNKKIRGLQQSDALFHFSNRRRQIENEPSYRFVRPSVYACMCTHVWTQRWYIGRVFNKLKDTRGTKIN